MPQFQIIIGCQFVNKGISQEVINSARWKEGGMGKDRQDSAGETTQDPVYTAVEDGERWGAALRGKQLRIWTRCVLPVEQILAGIRGVVKHSWPARNFGMKWHSAKQFLKPEEVPLPGEAGLGAVLVHLQPLNVLFPSFWCRGAGKQILRLCSLQKKLC